LPLLAKQPQHGNFLERGFGEGGEQSRQPFIGLVGQHPKKAGLELGLSGTDLHAGTVRTGAERQPADSRLQE
jgi:hypothetical protein